MNWNLVNITTIDIIIIVLSFSLGFLLAIFLEKNIWPNFNKKYSLGEYAKEKDKEDEEQTKESETSKEKDD